MDAIYLNVGGSLPGVLSFEMKRDGQQLSQGETQTEITLKDLSTDIASLERLLPPSIGRDLRQWALNDTSPTILAISSTDPPLDGIPWEHLPNLLQWSSVSVVRLLESSNTVHNGNAQTRFRLLAAGWPGKPFFQLPGIQDELNALSQLAVETDANVRVLFEPSPLELAEAYETIQPLVLHLIPPTIRSDDEMPSMVISGNEDIEWIRTDDFLKLLPGDHKPGLVVLNTCHGGGDQSGPSVTRIITEHLGSVSVSWLGGVQDQAAFDFSLFFYNRLILEGKSIIEALRAYIALQSLNRNPERMTRAVRLAHSFDPIPVVWTSALALITEPLLDLEPEEQAEEATIRSARGVETVPPADDYQLGISVSAEGQEEYATALRMKSAIPKVTLEFEPQNWLNPALLRNGRPAIVKLACRANQELHNVSLAITCDTGNGSSTVRQTVTLHEGRQPVSVDAFTFPILFQLIQANVSRRQINFTITCRYGSLLLAEITKSALWMERSEWLDKPETWHYISAFVQPESNGVHSVISKADPMLKNLVSPTSHFQGYQTGKKEFVLQQVEAIFNCLRSHFELNYIPPPPLPVDTPGDQLTSGQRVRMPNEVMDRKRGTCHDLAILFASCLEQARLYPLIVLITGHTFFGFWNDSASYDRFWEDAKTNLRRHQGAGSAWMISDIQEIRQLLDQEAVSFVEATEVTDRNAEFEKALQIGQRNLEPRPGRRFDVAVDVWRSRRYIRPI